MSKYDWSNVPFNVVSIATDSDGYAHGWGGIPIPVGGEWLGRGCKLLGFMLSPDENTFKGDWADSLEERPK